MSAWREERAARVSMVVFLLYLLAWAGLLCMILWKLWTTALSGLFP